MTLASQSDLEGRRADEKEEIDCCIVSCINRCFGVRA